MLQNERVRVVQLVKRDVDYEIFLRQCHVLVHLEQRSQNARFEGLRGDSNLESVVKVSNLAEIIEELVDPRLIVLNKRIDCNHIGLLSI